MPLCIDILKGMPSSFVSTCTICESRLKELIHNPSTHVDLGLELRDRFHRTWSDDDLAAFHLFTLDTTEESPHIVASLALGRIRAKLAENSTNTHSVQLLMEHL
jgi:hypothetical protein